MAVPSARAIDDVVAALDEARGHRTAPPAARPRAAPRAAPARARRPHGTRVRARPLRPLHARRPRRRLRLRQRAPAPRRGAPRLPDRSHADHQRHLAHLHRGRRLRSPRVVHRRGPGVEGGLRHHPPRRLGPRPRGMAALAPRRLAAAPPRRARGPRVLVRGRRLRPGARRPPPVRSRVGEGGDLGPGDGLRAALPVGPRRPHARPGQPRPRRPRAPPRRRPPRGRRALRRARDARRRLGVDGQPFHRLPLLPRPALPRVLRGLLRRGLPRPARRLVGDARARRHADLPKLGPAAAPPDLLRGAPGVGRMTARAAPPRVESHLDADAADTLAEDVLDGLTRPFKELPPKHLYDERGSRLFDRICELPEYYPTRTERAILAARAAELAAVTGAAELVELGSGTAAKTRLLLDAMAAAGTLRRYVPFDVSEVTVRAPVDELAG